MAAAPRDRFLAATYECIARYGLAKTTIEDVARAARSSRATVYRHFPGGREQLVRETIAWETSRFFLRLADAVADAPDFPGVLEEALYHAHRAIGEHELLQKLLQTEPERLLPTLTVEASRLLPLIAAFFRPYLATEELREGVDEAEAAEYVARLVVSFINAPGRWDLTDRAQIAELVRTEIVAGIVAPGGSPM